MNRNSYFLLSVLLFIFCFVSVAFSFFEPVRIGSFPDSFFQGIIDGFLSSARAFASLFNENIGIAKFLDREQTGGYYAGFLLCLSISPILLIVLVGADIKGWYFYLIAYVIIQFIVFLAIVNGSIINIEPSHKIKMGTDFMSFFSKFILGVFSPLAFISEIFGGFRYTCDLLSSLHGIQAIIYIISVWLWPFVYIITHDVSGGGGD